MAQSGLQHSPSQLPIETVYANTWYKGQLPYLHTVWLILSLANFPDGSSLTQWTLGMCLGKKKPHKESREHN